MQRDPALPRRPPMAQGYAPRAAPPPRPYYPPGPQDPRYRPHPKAQSFADPTSPTRYAESVVSEAESEQWPLPSRPRGQNQSRSDSPSGNQRRKPPRQSRDQYQYPPNTSRQSHRARPPPGAYQQQGPPRHHKPSAQWDMESYYSQQSGYGPPYGQRQPPPRSAQPYGPQGIPLQSRKPRYPPGAPPPAKMAPVNYNSEPVSATEEVMPEANWPLDLAGVNNSLLAPAVKNSERVKIPSYYFGQPDAETSVATSIDDNHDSPMESQVGSERGDSIADPRDGSSPEPAAPIRQASMGKKTRPTLTNISTTQRRTSSIRSGPNQSDDSQRRPSEQLSDLKEQLDALPDAWISEGPTPDENQHHEQAYEHGSEVALATAAAEGVSEQRDMHEEEKTISSPRRSSHLLGSPPLFADPAPSEFNLNFSGLFEDFRFESNEPEEEEEEEKERSPPFSPVLAAATIAEDEDLHDEPVSPIESEDFLSPIEAHMDRTEKRRTRPTSIEIEAVREAEARGSMTSLPDLIRRATTLRSNLDRGKTASRLGMNFFFNTPETDVDVEKYHANARKSGSISDMLTAFPSPGGTNEARKSLGNFSSMLRLSRIPSLDPSSPNAEKQREPRKYCGTPLWLCLVLLALVILLIAAAVVIPVVLVVLPKQHHTTSTTSSPSTTNHLTTLQQCEASLSCQNSGINIATKNDPCSCLCVNGYTGKTCSEQSSSGCSTMSIGSDAAKATVGEDVKTLLQTADSSYNIPINAETLLGLFSSNDMTCDTENALVTFSSGTEKKARSFEIPTATTSDDRRRSSRSRVVAAAAPSSSSTSDTGSPQEFAGAAVLYIFQETGEEASANQAKQSFQTFFSGRQLTGSGGSKPNPFNITLGNGFSCDLPQRKLEWRLGNGTVVGN